MTQQNIESQMANAIRFLAIDAIEAAKSGHPGMPMGMADVATVLFSQFLKFNPKDPKWLDRDRFVLSAGHGSMLLYALLYLNQYGDISLDDIKDFRQLNSKCAGHPEYGHLTGIETTTGPLGQGIANAVGLALGERMLAARLGNNVIDHKTYCIVGDGCLMEGISQEAISLAGHLNLNKLVVLWDDNSISIDGNINLTSGENMQLRFEACGWNFIKIDGHDYNQIKTALNQVQNSDKPTLIACKTTIGFGSPNKAGSEKCHGAPLGEEESQKTRQNLNWNYQPFEIPNQVMQAWQEASQRSQEIYQNWQNNFNNLENSKLNEIKRILNKELPQDFSQKLQDFKTEIFNKKPKEATRKSSNIALEFLTQNLNELIGGSADLTGSVLTKTTSTDAINKDNFANRYIHYGIREHAMGAIMNGLALHSNFIPYAGTFLVFADYMKPAIRLAALMQQQAIYIFTHDSIGLGEDGPTHQPIEHLAMLRAIPNLNVFRPADALETIEAFEAALENKNSPSAIVLSRQGLPFVQHKIDSNNQSKRGGYVISDCQNPNLTIIATGSELEIALQAQEKLKSHNVNAKVVSMPCFELFKAQSQDYQQEILGPKNILKVGIEAAISQGWDEILDQNSIFIGMNSFGASGKGSDLYKHFGLTCDNLCDKVLQAL